MYEGVAQGSVSGATHYLTTGSTVPLDVISSPGTYVCNWSGHLMRVPTASLTHDGHLALNIIGGQPLTATKISDDPELPVAEARGLAWSYGLNVGF